MSANNPEIQDIEARMDELGVTKQQRRAIRRALRDLDAEVNRVHHNGREYEFKRLELCGSEIPGRSWTLVFLAAETGMVGDEGSMACIFARDRHMWMFGPRGKVETADKNKRGNPWRNGYSFYIQCL